MKILVVTNLYPTERKPQWGVFVKEQIDSLKKTFPDDLKIDVYLIDGSKSKWEYIKALFLLPGIFKKNKYDLIHVHYGLTLVSLLLVSAPIIVTFHGSDLLTRPVKYISKFLKCKIFYAIVVSKNLQKELGCGAIIPCGIDVNKFFIPESMMGKYFQKNNQNRHIKVLFPADPLVKVKNYPLFKKICDELEKRGKIVREIHLKNIPRDEVPSIYWESDVMLLTSLSEGSPTVIKEAIATKLPFVSVDVGDVREWTDLINFGVIEETRNPKRMAERAIKLLDITCTRGGLDNTMAIERMDITNTARRIKSVYDDVLSSNDS